MRILIVDDDPEDIEIIQEYLEEIEDFADLQVEAVQRAEDAEPKMLSGEFDVCLVDQYMGGMSGTGLLKKLQEAGFVGRVVLVSGAADRSDKMDAMYYGAMDMLNKTMLSSAALANTIRFVMSQQPRALRIDTAS